MYKVTGYRIRIICTLSVSFDVSPRSERLGLLQIYSAIIYIINRTFSHLIESRYFTTLWHRQFFANNDVEWCFNVCCDNCYRTILLYTHRCDHRANAFVLNRWIQTIKDYIMRYNKDTDKPINMPEQQRKNGNIIELFDKRTVQLPNWISWFRVIGRIARSIDFVQADEIDWSVQ